jgi:hypothetical protein
MNLAADPCEFQVSPPAMSQRGDVDVEPGGFHFANV